MGARASWDLLMSNPNIFAGAVLASGATYVGPADLSKLVGIPIRNYIGSQDDVGLSQSANLTYASYVGYKAAGGLDLANSVILLVESAKFSTIIFALANRCKHAADAYCAGR